MANTSLSPSSRNSRISPFPDPFTIPSLLGKSNFAKWHNAILPHLASNLQSNALLFGCWSGPVSPLSLAPQSLSTLKSGYYLPISPVSSTSSAPSSSSAQSHLQASLPPAKTLTTFQTDRQVHELANLQTSRFIRATLAMNVIPFVRQHVSAKTLWEQLIYLYGEYCGINMAGGPAVFGVIDMKSMKLASIPGLQRIPGDKQEALRSSGEDEEGQTMLLGRPPANEVRRMTRGSPLGFGAGITPAKLKGTSSAKPDLQPCEKLHLLTYS